MVVFAACSDDNSVRIKQQIVEESDIAREMVFRMPDRRTHLETLKHHLSIGRAFHHFAIGKGADYRLDFMHPPNFQHSKSNGVPFIISCGKPGRRFLLAPPVPLEESKCGEFLELHFKITNMSFEKVCASSTVVGSATLLPF